jgi:hypothetical protein
MIAARVTAGKSRGITDSNDTKSTIAIDKYGQLKYERRQAGLCVLNNPRRLSSGLAIMERRE